jgi:hypothetical protein
MITKIWYSVQNCGDGSAYPEFMESEELAEFDQANMDEGWGESCTGCITIEHDSPITIKEKISTIDDKIKEFEEELECEYNSDREKKLYKEQLVGLKKMKGN